MSRRRTELAALAGAPDLRAPRRSSCPPEALLSLRRGPLALLAVTLLCAVLVPAASPSAAAQPTIVFAARSYQTGQPARLLVSSRPPAGSRVQVFRAGALGVADSSLGQDRAIEGVAVSAPLELGSSPQGPFRLTLHLGQWPSGVYFARLEEPSGLRRYAPFVLRPGAPQSRVLVVVPTNTWQAYDKLAGDSWYLTPAVTEVDLGRPYQGLGLPPHYQGYDLGFERWYAAFGARADWTSDEDLERLSAAFLRAHYDLIVFPGHEEYVTPHTRAAIEGFRDRGGSLAFLSSNDFFYRVDYHYGRVAGRLERLMQGRTRWRDLGYPEEELVGVHYVGWEEHLYRQRPYQVVSTKAAPWLFAGTDLRTGSSFGSYGIEIDQLSPLSPPGTRVLCSIPDDFGPGRSAEMTYYRKGRAQVFAAGVTNFGGSADWPTVRTLLANLWTRLSGQALEAPAP